MRIGIFGCGLQLLHDEPNDVLPPEGGGVVVPIVRERYHDCDFCGCNLTTRGEVMRLSDKARAMRDADETIAQLRRDLSKAEQECAQLRAQLSPTTARAARHVATVG